MSESIQIKILINHKCGNYFGGKLNEATNFRFISISLLSKLLKLKKIKIKAHLSSFLIYDINSEEGGGSMKLLSSSCV